MPTIAKKRLGELTVNNTDIANTEMLLFAQPWVQGGNGYRTVSMSFDEFATQTSKQIVQETNNGLVNTHSNNFIIGDGTVLNPLRPNFELLDKIYWKSAADCTSYVKETPSVGYYDNLNPLPIMVSSGWVLRINGDITYKLFDHALGKIIPANTLIDLTSFGLASLQNKVLYLTLVVANRNGNYAFELTETRQPESRIRTLFASLITDNTTVTNIVAPRVFRLGNVRLDEISRVIDYTQLVTPQNF